MGYLRCALINNDTVESIVLCDSEETANMMGLTPIDDTVTVGGLIGIKALQTENRLLKAQLQAQSDRADFIEDCIAEMAVQVYGGV